MNALLGSTVQILRHNDESIVDKFGLVTAVTNSTVSVQIDTDKQATRQVPISDIKVLKNEVLS